MCGARGGDGSSLLEEVLLSTKVLWQARFFAVYEEFGWKGKG